MNIFFDVDYTILGMDDTLRPGTRAVFQQLKNDGHHIYLWSGAGIRWPVVQAHKLTPFVTDCFMKPLGNYEQIMRALGIPVTPDLVVDDYVDVPNTLGGIWVTPYFYERTGHDPQMQRIYDIISSYARTGHSDDSRFRSPCSTGSSN